MRPGRSARGRPRRRAGSGSGRRAMIAPAAGTLRGRASRLPPIAGTGVGQPRRRTWRQKRRRLRRRRVWRNVSGGNACCSFHSPCRAAGGEAGNLYKHECSITQVRTAPDNRRGSLLVRAAGRTSRPLPAFFRSRMSGPSLGGAAHASAGDEGRMASCSGAAGLHRATWSRAVRACASRDCRAGVGAGRTAAISGGWTGCRPHPVRAGRFGAGGNARAGRSRGLL